MKFLIDFKQDAASVDIEGYLLANNCAVIKQYQNYEEVYLVSADTTPPITDIVETVVADDANPINLMNVSSDIAADAQYGQYSNVEEKDWWKVSSVLSPDFDTEVEYFPIKGKNVTVYIMDSGIDATHPEFADADIQTLHSFTGEFADTNGHGTALASVIAGKTCGMTAATVKVVKVFDKNVTTLQSDLLTAFDAIYTDFISNGQKASVLNMSWGIDKNDFIESKIAKLMSAGVYAVAAAGNNGVEIGSVTPASMDAVVTIGSYGQDFNPSNFSNYSSAISTTQDATNGGALDGWAPGENIYTAIPGGTYGLVSGTSIAAAIHTAATVYNLEDVVTSEGHIAIQLISEGDYMQTFVNTMGFYRRNLIHLDDPKYANSVNVATTFKTKPEDVLVGAGAQVKFRSGQKWGLTIALGTAVSNITCDALPDGVVLDGGSLLGQIEITDGSTWKYFEIDMIYTLRAGGTAPYKVKMWVVTDDYDPADPTADPELAITPFAVGGSCLWNGSGCIYQSGCTACYNCGDNKTPDCTCTNMECR